MAAMTGVLRAAAGTRQAPAATRASAAATRARRRARGHESVSQTRRHVAGFVHGKEGGWWA
eukprot:7014407-Prymnesium_polylepis.1